MVDDPCAGDHLVIQNVMVIDTVGYEACRITAGPDYTVSATGNVTLRAGYRVTLKPGFVVRSRGALTVEINPNLYP